MSRYALISLAALLLGAVLWIALSGGDRTDADNANDEPSRAQPDTGSGMTADADDDATLRAKTPQKGALVLTVVSDDARAFQVPGILITLQSESDEAASLLVHTTQTPYRFGDKRTTWKGAPTCAATASGFTVELPKIPRGRWTAIARVLAGGPPVRSAPVHVDVTDDGGSAELRLLRERRVAALRVSVVQGARTIPEASVQVSAGPMNVASGESAGANAAEDDSWIEVPAGQPLTVNITYYRGGTVFGKLEPKTVELAAKERRELVFEVPPGQSIRVRTVSSHGEKVAASLVLWTLGSGEPKHISVMDVMRAEGQAGWHGVLPTGRYRVMVAPHAHYARAYDEIEVVEDTEEQVFDVTAADRGVRITLVLSATDTSRSAKQRLNLNRITTDPGQADFFGGRTDEKGRVVSRPLAPGRYRLYLWDLNLSREVDGAADATHTLEVPPPLPAENEVAIRGRVYMHDGTPANGLYVHARDAETGWDRLGRCDADGRFEIKGLEPGVYEVYVPVRLLGKRTYKAGRRTVQVGTTSTTIKIQLEE